MSNLSNTLQINTLASLTRKAPGHVINAIENASTKTGVSFSYLVQQAKAESAFNPMAKARTSSAAGLYQFIDKTWLGMVKNHGHKYGLGDMANKIDDRFRVSDVRTKRQILDLRNNPKVASHMAAEFALENKQFLESHWGGKVGSTELYFAHFLGAGGASSFLKSMDQNPFRPAADLFPRAARANAGVFYDSKTGQAKTLAQVYDFFDKKFSIKGGDMSVASAPVPAQKPEIMAGLTNTSVPILAEKADPMMVAFAPVPAHKPEMVNANLKTEAKDFIPRERSNSLIMAQSENIRQEHMKKAHGRIDGAAFMDHALTNNIQPRQSGILRSAQSIPAMQVRQQALPFHSLITKPVDLMLLSQDTEQERDKKV